MNRAGASLIAVGLLIGAVGGTRALEAARGRAALGQARGQAALAATRYVEAISAQRTAMEARAENAAANPRLAAAMGGGVDARTLRDLLDTETWWERYRREFAVQALLRGRAALVTRGPFEDFDASALVAEAASANGARSRLFVGQRGATLVAVAPLEVAAWHQDPAFVLLGRPLGDEALDAIVASGARAADGVLITDGARSFASAGAAAGALRAAIGGERRDGGSFVPGDEAWVATARPLSDGVWLWARAPVTPGAAGLGRWNKALLWSGAGLGALVAFALGFRRGRRAPPAVAAVPEELRAAAPSSPIVADTTGSVIGSNPALGPMGVPGRVMGRYLLIDRIGQGGMADVFTAVTFGVEGFRRRFVIKRLRRELSENADAIAHFIDEANLGANLVHPNIVPVYDFGTSGAAHYLAQEYIPGRDLGQVTRQLLDRRRTLMPPAALLWITGELVQALDYAHRRVDPDGQPLGIVHRDVTPENVMLSERGEVKLLDFGVVKTNSGRVPRTERGVVKGSAAFMAPEQARGLSVDARADVFALGMVMFSGLTGRNLYAGATDYDLLIRAAAGPGPDEMAQVDALPAPFADIIRRAIAPAPADRYQSAMALGRALAPHIVPCSEIVGALVRDLFAAELEAERRRIDAATPSSAASLAATPAAGNA